jgi:HSP20 family protein
MFSLMPRRVRGAMPRWEPFEELRREFAPLFERAFPVLPIPMETPWETPWGLAMEELENEFVVRAEVPGFEASELEVTLAGNVLTIRAEHGKPPEGETPPPERRYARYERTVTLPEMASLEGLEAVYRNGILEVHVPRIPEARPRRIEVRT